MSGYWPLKRIIREVYNARGAVVATERRHDDGLYVHVAVVEDSFNAHYVEWPIRSAKAKILLAALG